MRITSLLLVVPGILLGWVAGAAAAGIGDFAGDWVGVATVSEGGSARAAREIDFKLSMPKNLGGGFLVLSLWHKPGRAIDVDNPARLRGFEFRPTGVAGHWRGQDRCVPESELGCAWARLDGRTLIVTTLAVDGDGRVETQVARRTLAADGIEGHFVSSVEGEVRRSVSGRLRRKNLE